MKQTATKKCQNRTCRKPFRPNNGKQKFCSDRCRWETWARANPRVRALNLPDGVVPG